jgi:hypothetical protein
LLPVERGLEPFGPDRHLGTTSERVVMDQRHALECLGPAPKGPVYLISLGLPNCRSQDVRYSAALGGSAEVE